MVVVVGSGGSAACGAAVGAGVGTGCEIVGSSAGGRSGRSYYPSREVVSSVFTPSWN